MTVQSTTFISNVTAAPLVLRHRITKPFHILANIRQPKAGFAKKITLNFLIWRHFGPDLG